MEVTCPATRLPPAPSRSTPTALAQLTAPSTSYFQGAGGGGAPPAPYRAVGQALTLPTCRGTPPQERRRDQLRAAAARRPRARTPGYQPPSPAPAAPAGILSRHPRESLPAAVPSPESPPLPPPPRRLPSDVADPGGKGKPTAGGKRPAQRNSKARRYTPRSGSLRPPPPPPRRPAWGGGRPAGTGAALPPPGPAGGMGPKAAPRPHSQDAGAGGAHEAAHRHVGVGGAALVAVEALAVGREAAHLPQQLQVLLLLLPLGARGHGPAGEGTARHHGTARRGAGPRSHPGGGGAPGPGRRERGPGRGRRRGGGGEEGEEGAGRATGARR